MRGSCLVLVLLCAAQVLTLVLVRSGCAEDSAAPSAVHPTPSTSKAPGPSTPAPQPVVAAIRAKLADPDLRKGADADDLTALEAFYDDRSSGPLWTTDMGLSAKGQQSLLEIEKADDWGLDKHAFDLPPVSALPTVPEEQAIAEIKLNLAILKYARFARGGRSDPAALGGKVFQSPSMRDPKTVLTEIAAAEAPDAYLRSLHPQHTHFARLRLTLLAARDGDAAGDSNTDVKRIVMNMERWRWMPEDLGRVYVWSNTPAFMLYVIKDGETIYTDKTQVGTIDYATPVISDNMTEVVFNPEWVAPPTVLREDLLPLLRKKRYATLKRRGFSVSYRGSAIDPAKIDWDKANILAYTFIQKPGPNNNVGKVKFRMPNKHAFILHDTWPARRKYYQKSMRAVGRDCVRMEKPDDFAKVILAESNGWPESTVNDLWDNSVNNRVTLDLEIPVYSTYFTAVADAQGKVTTYPDLYGLDHKLARALFDDTEGFPMPTRKAKRRRAVSKSVRWKPPGSDVTRSLQGFPSR